MNPVILIADDEKEAAELTVSLVKPHLPVTTDIVVASTHLEAISVLKKFSPQLVISDLALDPNIGPESGFALIKELQRHNPRPEIIVLTSHHETRYGIQALKLGASAFLSKPPHPEHLAGLILNGLSNSALRAAFSALKEEKTQVGIIDFLGQSAEAEKIREQIRFASSSRLPVLITGESGTGKGLVAHSIHRMSKFKGKFVRYQANFVSADLFASEMFGHTKGAFTGALGSRRGLLLEANDGTFFLDEIDELPIPAQVTLLGVLQDKIFRQLGSNIELSTGFRLISATNRPIKSALDEGKLRRDFFHRISAITIHIPPLRERKEDIESICLSTLEKAQLEEELPIFGFSEETFAALTKYDWPGNVRELIQEVNQALHRALFRGDNRVEPCDLSITAHLLETTDKAAIGGNLFRDLMINDQLGCNSFYEQVKSFKKALVMDALKKSDSNQVRAARLLGIDRGSLRRLLE